VATLGSSGAIAFIATAPILIGSLAETRFDMWPATLTVAAIVALLLGRHRTGWGLLGAAVAAKVFAIVLVPLAVMWTLRQRGRPELRRAASIGALVTCGFFLPFAVLAPGGLWASLWGQASRPLEIESLPAAFLETFGHPHVVSAAGALAIAGHGTLEATTTVVGVIVIAALWLLFGGGESSDDRFIRYAAACVAAFIAFDKVLSPQYLIWLVPLVPLVRGRRGLAAVALLIIAFLVTDLFSYNRLRFGHYAFSGDLAWLMLARDLILVALVAILGVPGRDELRRPVVDTITSRSLWGSRVQKRLTQSARATVHSTPGVDFVYRQSGANPD
jgi:hypothetical protein